MKSSHFLYSLGVLAVVGILACFLVYSTETFPVHIREQQAPVETAPSVRSQQKTCSCCKETMDHVRKRIQQAGERRQAVQHAETQAQVPQKTSSKAGDTP